MSVLYNIPYGLYVLTAKDKKHNGCIINTCIQVTANPEQIMIAVNKDNHTTKMIEKTGVFNISILDTTATFDIIKRFGFASGKDTDKFDYYSGYKIASNKVAYITAFTNGYISAEVVEKIDVGTHYIFVARITDKVELSKNPTLTYSYYQSNIKPKPTVATTKKTYVCRICGYEHDGDLPADFICPICKHGVADFELINED